MEAAAAYLTYALWACAMQVRVRRGLSGTHMPRPGCWLCARRVYVVGAHARAQDIMPRALVSAGAEFLLARPEPMAAVYAGDPSAMGRVLFASTAVQMLGGGRALLDADVALRLWRRYRQAKRRSGQPPRGSRFAREVAEALAAALPAGTRVVEEAWLLPGFRVDLFVPSFNLVVEADGALPRWWWWWWGLCVVAVMCRVGCGTCA